MQVVLTGVAGTSRAATSSDRPQLHSIPLSLRTMQKLLLALLIGLAAGFQMQLRPLAQSRATTLRMQEEPATDAPVGPLADAADDDGFPFKDIGKPSMKVDGKFKPGPMYPNQEELPPSKTIPDVVLLGAFALCAAGAYFFPNL